MSKEPPSYILKRSGPPGFPSSWLTWLMIAGAVLLFLFFLATDAFYVIEPTEMAGVRRFGTVLTKEPIKPGLHLKLPWIDTVDRIQTSLETYHLDRLTVNTIDNQPIDVNVGLTYRVPADAVLQLLYTVGRAGNFDIGDNFKRIIADRSAKIFAQQNTTRISESRNRISDELKALLAQDLRRLYGVEVIDFQISDIVYSASFRASVETAVRAKNEAVAAENTVNRIKFEAQQNIERANGEAESKLRLAEAERRAAILTAQGRAESIRLEGESRAAILKLTADAIRNNPQVVELSKVDRWNGSLPNTLIEGSGTTPLFTLPSLPPQNSEKNP